MPGPAGGCQWVRVPGAGMKLRPPSSALIRNSIEWPRTSGSSYPISSPAAMRNISRTRSMPVTSSETQCSTWRRVLTSRKEIVPSCATRNSHVAAEGGDGLADRGLVGVGDLLERAGDLEAAAAAAEDGLDRDRQPVGLGELDDLVGVLDRVLGARREGGLRLVGDVLGPGLVAQRLDRGGRGTDPDQPGVDDGLGELGVLGEEPVAGVDAVGAGLLRDRDDLGDVEVGLGRGGATEGVGLVGEAHEEGVAVRVGVDRDRSDPGVLAGADDADGDLAAVGDEDLLQTHATTPGGDTGWVATGSRRAYRSAGYRDPSTARPTAWCTGRTTRA